MICCQLLTLLFNLLFLLLLLAFCLLWTTVCIAQAQQATNNIDLFEIKGNIKPLSLSGSGEPNTEYKVESFENTFLVAADDLMVALAEAKTIKTPNGEGKSAHNLLTKYIKNKGEKRVYDVLKNGGSDWTTQLATDEIDPPKIFLNKKCSAVVAKDSKIYFFVVNSTLTDQGSSASGNSDVVVVIGEVENGGTTTNKKITWKSENIFKFPFNDGFADKIKAESKIDILSISPTGSFAFLAGEKNKKIVFLVRNKAGGDKKNVTAFIQLKENVGSKGQLELLHVETAEKCYPYFFPWGDKIMMIPTDCGVDRNQKVKESTDMVTWDESSESFSCLWDAFQDKKGFTTTTIDDEKPILFTYNNNKKSETILWISDGTRMANVGIIITKDEGLFYGSILYTNKELFTLYKKNASPPQGTETTFVLKRLKDVMDKITRVVNAWRSSDDAVSKLCTGNAVSEKYNCVKKFPKNGLVGFLFDKGNANEKIWEDRYLYENAKLNSKGEAETMPHGFRFTGDGAGATWSVGKAEDQPYNFAEPGFTLAATVKIDKITTDKDNSIFGVELTTTEKSIGLLCTKDATWGVKVKNAQNENSENMEPNRKCVQGEKYQVALVYSGKNKLSVYVDWEILGSAKPFEMNKENQKELEFYFGNDGTQANVESHVTVTDVLLYNRPLTVSEIKELKKNVKPVQVTTNPNESAITDTTGGDQHPPPLPPQDPIGKEKEEMEKTPSPSRTEDGGVGGGVRVFFLLLAVLCFSAPLLHL